MTGLFILLLHAYLFFIGPLTHRQIQYVPSLENQAVLHKRPIHTVFPMKFLWKRSTQKREREYSITKRVECVTTPLSRDFAKRWSIARVKVRGGERRREGEEQILFKDWNFRSPILITYALSFYRSQNVLCRSKFFVPDQKFIYIQWQSQKFCTRQKYDLHSVKLFFVPAQKFLKRH